MGFSTIPAQGLLNGPEPWQAGPSAGQAEDRERAHVLCQWCRFERIPWWAFWQRFCPMCKDLRADVLLSMRTEHLALVGTIARVRMLADARRTDIIPGIDRKPLIQAEWDGPERRKKIGTIYDRKGYLHNALFNPDHVIPDGRNLGIPVSRNGRRSR